MQLPVGKDPFHLSFMIWD